MNTNDHTATTETLDKRVGQQTPQYDMYVGGGGGGGWFFFCSFFF
eukprot:SAG31_NODE_43746_length_265_cov_1.945783_1_plen_44_part_01